jgi:5-methylthioadenosine/S-adenosylhomocysteine deaminase
MQEIDTLIRARWIVPVEPEGLVFEHYALAVDEGRIVELLPQDEAAQRYRATEVVDCPTHALIPGLVNAHTHASMSLFRGLADDLPLMDWLDGHIWPAEAQWVDAQFVRDGSALAIAEMLRGGTTCFNDMYFFPEATAAVAGACGVRACIGLIVIDFPSAWARNADEYLTKGVQLHEEYLSHALITTALAPHAPYTVGDEALRRIHALANELDMQIHMHVHETEDEVRQSLERFGVRPLERLAGLGLVSPRLMAVHMTQLTPGEIAQIGEAGAHVLHCPESNLKLASGFCPVQSLLQAGANVALGTDGAASNNDLDMLVEMRLAALKAKAVARDARALPAARALRMATLNGAEALGLDQEIGSLLPGKSADLVALDLGGVECEPVYNPISQIAYSIGRESVRHVWVAGRQLLRDRALTTLDEGEVVAKARAWRDRIAGRSLPG